MAILTSPTLRGRGKCAITRTMNEGLSERFPGIGQRSHQISSPNGLVQHKPEAGFFAITPLVSQLTDSNDHRRTSSIDKHEAISMYVWKFAFLQQHPLREMRQPSRNVSGMLVGRRAVDTDRWQTAMLPKSLRNVARAVPQLCRRKCLQPVRRRRTFGRRFIVRVMCNDGADTRFNDSGKSPTLARA